MKKSEIDRLEKWCKKFFDKNQIGFDSFDFESHLDRKICFSENKEILREKLKLFFNEFSKENVEKMDSKEIKEIESRTDNQQKRLIQEQEEIAKKEFQERIELIKQSDIVPISNYSIPKEYIRSVAKGYNRGFIFLGRQGLGKSYLTRQILARENCKFIESRGVNSPMALYQFLYENNEEDKVIVFDDVSGLVNSPNAFSILLGALWDNLVQWNTTSKKLEVPSQFIFKGRIIIIANSLEGEKAEIVKSRCLVYDLKLSREDKVKMMYFIAKQKHDKLKEKERFEIVDYLKEITDDSTKNFDLRTQAKIESLYMYDNKNWKKISKPLVVKDNKVELLIECLNNSPNVREAQKSWCNETGSSRRTFFRIKKTLGVI